MWSSFWTWAKANKILAIAIVVLGIVALSGVADGWSARNAARRYFDLAKGWAAAYQRDTAASKKEYEGKIEALTADRDAYKNKYDQARKRMGAPWVPPKNPGEIEERFLKMGFRGKIR